MEPPTKVGLSKELGPFELTATGVGIILGAGIYVIIGRAAGLAGGAIWIPFLASAVAAVFTGLSYAELSSSFPSAAASFEYSRQAFGARVAFVVGWLMIFANIVSASAVALGFGGYLSSLVGLAVAPMAVLLVLVSSGILVIGVKETVRLGVLFTLIEVAGLLLVTTVSVRFWGGVDYFEMPEGIGGVFRATTLIFFAYLGFEELASLSEEAKNPRRMIPLAVLLAIGLTTILYLAVSVSSVSVIDGQTLRESDAPLSDVVRVAANPGIASTLSIIALFATANTVLFLLLASSRMMYGMASTGNLPRALSLVHPRKKTPWVATIVAGAFGIGFTMIGDIETVAQLTNFAVLVAFVMVNSSLVWLRFSRSDLTPQFRVPLNIGRLPIPGLIGIGTSLFMLANIRPGLLIAGVAVAGVGVVFPFFWKSQTPTADAEVAADPR